MPLLQEIKVPLIAVNDTTLTVVELSVNPGDFVKKGSTVMVFETSKTTYNVEAEADGFIEYLCEVDKDYEVNDVVAKVFSEEHEVKKIASTLSTGAVEKALRREKVEVAANWEGETLYSAEALRLIDSKQLDHSIFKGRDFVSKQDVEELLGIETKPKKTIQPQKEKGKPKSAPQVDPSTVIVEKLSSNKRREIEFLSEVQSIGLTSTIHVFVDTEGIFGLLNGSLKFLKNSLLPVIIYEVSRLLHKYPLLNAYFSGEGIASYKEVNPGFAIDIDKGLKVLKIANASKKMLGEIENDIMELSGKYLDDKLPLEDLVGISFTITDLSSEGVAFFKPLINSANSAILGVSSIDEKLHRCALSLTFDHRVTEGKYVALFLGELKQRLESYQSKHHKKNTADVTCFKCFKNLDKDLTDVGFVKCITPEGNEGYICQSCFKGY